MWKIFLLNTVLSKALSDKKFSNKFNYFLQKRYNLKEVGHSSSDAGDEKRWVLTAQIKSLKIFFLPSTSSDSDSDSIQNGSIFNSLFWNKIHPKTTTKNCFENSNGINSIRLLEFKPKEGHQSCFFNKPSPMRFSRVNFFNLKTGFCGLRSSQFYIIIGSCQSGLSRD